MCFGLDIQAIIVGRIQQGYVKGLGNQMKAVAGYPGSVGRRVIPDAGYPGGEG